MAAPDKRTDAGFQLRYFERFGKIIVRAAIQSGDPAIEAGIGREDDNRDVVAGLSEPLEQRHSVNFRKRQIENDDGIHRYVQEMSRVFAVVCDIDRIIRLLERLAKPRC